MTFREKTHWVSLVVIATAFGWYFFRLHTALPRGPGNIAASGGLLTVVTIGIILAMSIIIGVIAAAPVDDNIFASPQANAAGPAVRAYHAGDFVATESDSAATLLVAGKVALALGAFGAVMLMSVFFKWVIWPFALLAALLFMASGAIAFTTLLRGWLEAGLRRIGVMRASSSGAETRVVVYSALAGAVALFGLAATTLFWFL